MDEYTLLWIFIALFLVAMLFCFALRRYYRKIVEHQRNQIINLISGGIFSESLLTVALAYGYTDVNDLIDVIERDMNSRRAKK